jgi:hypothetical protein
MLIAIIIITIVVIMIGSIDTGSGRPNQSDITRLDEDEQARHRHQSHRDKWGPF